MKKVIIYIILVGSVYILFNLAEKVYRYYVQTKQMTTYRTAQHNDDTIRIAYIGDSWAYMHQQHKQCLIPQMIKTHTHHPTKVYSYGLGGRTSKEIYEALFEDSHLMNHLEKQGCDYCFISIGINDINKKKSVQSYKESMNGIICFFLSNNVHPIILEVPDFNVDKAYQRHPSYKKLINHLSMIVNKVPFDCKQMYRDALNDLIEERGYQNKISIIRYKSWNDDYTTDQKKLYKNDGFHLNDYGYAVLDSIIAKTIISRN